MGSIGEDDDSQPSSCNGRFLDGCGAVNHAASVPKKLRSAIKKRGRESITLKLPIPKKKHHAMNGVSVKKSKRKGHITKDEEEVAETLYALAGMFTDSKEADETKSSAILNEGDSINAAQGEESRETGSKVMIGAAASHPSTEDFVKSQSLGAQQPKTEPAIPSALGVSGVQNGVDDKCKDVFLSPNLSATGAPSSETQKSCSRIPAWFESSILSSQPRVTANNINTEKVQCAPVSVHSQNSWKRCTAHVYISRLIKVMQISGRKESSPEKPTELTACVKQIPVINGRTSGESSSGMLKDSSEIQTDILVQTTPVQDQQMATETPAFKQAYDFLSLGTGESVSRGGHSDEGRVQYRAPYMQSQHHPAMPFPFSQNGHSSTFHTHSSAFPTPQVPQYQSNFAAQTGQQQLQTHYNNSSGGVDSASVLNYAHALFPHLNAALAAKYQQFLPSQRQLLPFNNTLALPLIRHQHHFPVGFERNPENMQHLQLHHLRNQ